MPIRPFDDWKQNQFANDRDLITRGEEEAHWLHQ